MADPADLSNLRDLVLPPAVSLWPPAPGWWIIAAAGLAAAAILSAAAVARYQRNAYRREALRQLDTVDPGGISTVLKRTALAAWPRDQVAALTGSSWLAFLDHTGRTTAFTAGAGRHIETLAFGGVIDGPSADAARAEAKAWVRGPQNSSPSRFAMGRGAFGRTAAKTPGPRSGRRGHEHHD